MAVLDKAMACFTQELQGNLVSQVWEQEGEHQLWEDRVERHTQRKTDIAWRRDLLGVKGLSSVQFTSLVKSSALKTKKCVSYRGLEIPERACSSRHWMRDSLNPQDSQKSSIYGSHKAEAPKMRISFRKMSYCDVYKVTQGKKKCGDWIRSMDSLKSMVLINRLHLRYCYISCRQILLCRLLMLLQPSPSCIIFCCL